MKFFIKTLTLLSLLFLYNTHLSALNIFKMTEIRLASKYFGYFQQNIKTISQQEIDDAIQNLHADIKKFHLNEKQVLDEMQKKIEWIMSRHHYRIHCPVRKIDIAKSVGVFVVSVVVICLAQNWLKTLHEPESSGWFSTQEVFGSRIYSYTTFGFSAPNPQKLDEYIAFCHDRDFANSLWGYGILGAFFSSVVGLGLTVELFCPHKKRLKKWNFIKKQLLVIQSS